MYSLFSDVAVTTTSADVNTGALFTAVLISSLIGYALAVIPIWAIFVKAGEPGWQALIPIWNTVVLLKIVGKPVWWIILFFIPIVNIVFVILTMHALSLSFGHGAGFTVGLIFLSLIFYYILAFDSSRYQGAAGYSAAPVGYATA
jgi:hypothetical protein